MLDSAVAGPELWSALNNCMYANADKQKLFEMFIVQLM